jgi:hypothetical protein
MTPFKSALEASSYQSPDLDGPFHHLRQKVVQAMVDQGIERSTLVEHGVSWAEDQDPFGHVMGQTYPHVISKTFTRLLESFQEVLKDKFSELVAGRGISVMTNRCNLTAIQMVKYPDLVCKHLFFLRLDLKMD